MPHLRTRLLVIGAAILITILGGTLGFILIEHYDPFDAFYMTMITVTTVGYQELHPLSRAGRVFNSFLMFFGVTTLLLAVGGMTQTVIELELNQYFGKRRIRKMIEFIEDHYIVCGFGRVGRGAATELKRAGVPFLIVDRDEEKVEGAMRAGMLAVLSDANRDDALLEAGLMRAKGLIATLASDAENLFLVMSAKSLNANVQISARISEEGSEQKMRRAGADFVFAPYSITGNRMALSLLRPHVSQFIDFTTNNMGLNVGIEQVQVREASRFASQPLSELPLRDDAGLIVLAVRRKDGTMLFNPSPNTAIEGGDFLLVMGEPEHLQKLDQAFSEDQA